MREFIAEQKGISLVHSAHYYLAWYYCSHKNSTDYKKEISAIEALPEALFPADKNVGNRISSQKTCNSYLVKSRMLFDAEEYSKALAVLKEKNIDKQLKTYEEKIEYIYRLARIYEHSKQIEKAIQLYSKVVKTQKSELYFVPYSAYCLGKIYENQSEINLAKQYYNIALDLNEGEYKTSIEKKCQFALNRLSKQ